LQVAGHAGIRLSHICNTWQESAGGRKAMQKELQVMQDQLAQTKKQAQVMKASDAALKENLPLPKIPAAQSASVATVV
jgi:hypothetical protein